MLPGPADYPEKGTNKLGWPQRLSGCSADDRKLLPAWHWCMIPWSCSPQHYLPVKQACAQQAQKCATLHTAWTFILGSQAPWARSAFIFHLLLCLHTNLLHSIANDDQWTIFSSNQFLWPTKQSTYFLKPLKHSILPAKPFLLNSVTLKLYHYQYTLLCSAVHYEH